MPYMGYYGIDMYYIVLVLPCVLFAFWAQSQVNGTFNRYSRVMSRRGLTGAQAAQAVLRANGVTGVSIEYVAGKLTDILIRGRTRSACPRRSISPPRSRPSAWPRMRRAMRCSMRSAIRPSACATPSFR